MRTLAPRALRLLLIALLSLGIALPAHAGKAERAAHLAEKADAAYNQGDLLEAFKLANKALKLDPALPYALYLRGMIAFTVGGQVGGPEGAALLLAALNDLAQVAVLAPDTTYGSIARDTIASMTAQTPFPSPRYDCPADAQAELEEAERLYSVHRFDEARGHYEQALAGCPSNADWWVYYGDIFFMAGNWSGARQQYGKALALDPCNWTAHRFMADAWSKEADSQESYASLLRATTCNPGYAAARQNLQQLVSAHHGAWSWSAAPPRARQNSLGGAWAALAAARARQTAGSPLEQERAAVREALALWRQRPDNDPIWRALSGAEERGELDAAIFLLLMDPALYPEYIPWRDSHHAELIRFAGSYLAPAPGLEIR